MGQISIGLSRRFAKQNLSAARGWRYIGCMQGRLFGILSWPLRHKLLVATLVLLALLITPIIIVTRTWLISNPDQRPRALPTAFALEEQTEPHTCGVHAISTVYKAYGLDPEAEQIRRRLGADVKAVFYVPDSTGTLHPDMWMVMVQDYFAIEAIDLDTDSAWTQLRDHLAAGHPAILLIKTRETGNLHWVVATQAKNDGKIEVFDPLFDQPYAEGEDFLAEHIVTVGLVEPTGSGEMAMSSVDAHLAGMAALEDATKRMKPMKK